MRLRTLGGLSLEDSDFHWPKPLLLVSFLALEGRQDRRRVARLFWPDAADDMNSLTVALSQLRRGAPGIVEADRTTVATPVTCDAAELMAALETESLDQALGIYRGPFLDGVHQQSWGVELEEWLYDQRERLSAALRSALIAAAEVQAAAQRFQAGARYAEIAHALDEAPPLAPEALEHLVDLLVAGESPRAGRVCREAEAFGAARPVTVAVARERLQVSSLPPPARELPSFSGPLVGRDTELDALADLLHRPDVRLVTITGPGGIGKTRLAVALAEREGGRDTTEGATFPDGLFFVSMEGVRGTDGIVRGVAEALGLPLDGARDPGAALGGGDPRTPRRQLLDYLRHKGVMLVLDNFEHLEGEAVRTLLTDILQASSRLGLLVTSRERLRLRDEQLFHLQGLAHANRSAAVGAGDPGAAGSAAAGSAAADLFLQRARRVAPEFALATEDVAPLDDICRLVEGMPLALELAAMWADTLPLTDIADGIRRNLDFLGSTLEDVPDRHRSIRAVFDYAYQRLARDEQAAFARLSVFRGGFTRDAAEVVAGASARTLSAMVAKSLLRFDRDGARYRMHELVRQYGADRLESEVGGSAQLQEHHSDFFRQRLEHAALRLEGASRAPTLSGLELETENLLTAWHWAAAHAAAASLSQAADAFGSLLQRSGRFQEGAAAFREATAPGAAHPLAATAAAAGKAGSPRTEHRMSAQHLAKLLAWQGVFEHLRAEPPARETVRRCLALLDEAEVAGADVRSERAFARLQLGRMEVDADLDAAERCFDECLRLYQDLEAESGTADALRALGDVAVRRGDGLAATDLFGRSLSRYRQLGDDRGVVGSLSMLCYLAMYGAQFETAAALAQECYGLCRRIGDRASVANGLGLLAMSYFWLGRFSESRSLFAEALALHSALGNRPALPQAHGYVGLASLRLGRYDEARAHGEGGLRLARELDNQGMVGWCLWLLGCAALGQESLQEAERLLEESVTTFGKVGRESELGWALAVLGHVQRRLGRSRSASETLRGVLARSAAVRDFPSAILALSAVALLQVDADKGGRALELLGLLSRYPVVRYCHWFEDIAIRRLTAVADELPPGTAREARARGEELDLWETATALLDEFAVLDAESGNQT